MSELAQQTPEGGTPIAGENPIYLKDPVLDATVRMVVELAAQVWIERERRMTLETLLEAQGTLSRAAIESFKPDAAQAAAFKAACDVTGIFLAKLDGTAKGGIVVAIRDAIDVPVKLVGVGETPEDVQPFDADAFVEAMFAA